MELDYTCIGMAVVRHGVLEMMHGMHRGAAVWIDLRETLAIDANCNEMPRVQWAGM